jgi:pilus assembly protein Flp/PilA
MLNRLYAYIYSMTHDDEGQALVEYALILALVAIVSIAALELLGTNVSSRLDQIAKKIKP